MARTSPPRFRCRTPGLDYPHQLERLPASATVAVWLCSQDKGLRTPAVIFQQVIGKCNVSVGERWVFESIVGVLFRPVPV